MNSESPHYFARCKYLERASIRCENSSTKENDPYKKLLCDIHIEVIEENRILNVICSAKGCKRATFMLATKPKNKLFCTLHKKRRNVSATLYDSAVVKIKELRKENKELKEFLSAANDNVRAVMENENISHPSSVHRRHKCGCCEIKDATVVGQRCGHIYMCEDCAKKCVSGVCPICRVKTDFTVVIYS